jgi:hypothetical protein
MTAVGLAFAQTFSSSDPYDDLAPGTGQDEAENEITRRTWQQRHRKGRPWASPHAFTL